MTRGQGQVDQTGTPSYVDDDEPRQSEREKARALGPRQPLPSSQAFGLGQFEGRASGQRTRTGRVTESLWFTASLWPFQASVSPSGQWVCGTRGPRPGQRTAGHPEQGGLQDGSRVSGWTLGVE